jgi:hypothetical protein
MNERDKELFDKAMDSVEEFLILDPKKFAALIRADEREACAKVCEDAPEPDGKDLAERIRARGNA